MSSLEQAGSPLDKPKPGDEITEFDRKVYLAMNKAYAQMQLLAPHNEFLVQHLALNQPPLSVSNLFGFSRFTVQAATPILTSEQTNSVTYTALATAGPTLTELADGNYLILFGCSASIDTATANTARMSLEVNGVAASDNDMALSGTATQASVARAILRQLTAGSNSIVAKYRSTDTGTNGVFANRWLLALRYANL